MKLHETVVTASHCETLDDGWEGLTTDGHVVRIRLATVDDVRALRELGFRLSDRTLYLRFFSVNRDVAGGYLGALARPSDIDHIAVVAAVGDAVVAVADWARTGPAEGEFVLLVEDAHQQQGIEPLLIEDVTARARAAGITRLGSPSWPPSSQHWSLRGAPSPYRSAI